MLVRLPDPALAQLLGERLGVEYLGDPHMACARLGGKCKRLRERALRRCLTLVHEALLDLARAEPILREPVCLLAQVRDHAVTDDRVAVLIGCQGTGTGRTGKVFSWLMKGDSATLGVPASSIAGNRASVSSKRIRSSSRASAAPRQK